MLSPILPNTREEMVDKNNLSNVFGVLKSLFGMFSVHFSIKQSTFFNSFYKFLELILFCYVLWLKKVENIELTGDFIRFKKKNNIEIIAQVDTARAEFIIRKQSVLRFRIV